MTFGKIFKKSLIENQIVNIKKIFTIRTSKLMPKKEININEEVRVKEDDKWRNSKNKWRKNKSLET